MVSEGPSGGVVTIIATLRWASCSPGTGPVPGPQDAQCRVAIIVTTSGEADSLASGVSYAIYSGSCLIPLRAHLHQRGAGLPAGAGSVFRAGWVFTLARVRTQFHFTGAPFRGIGSLIYKYRPISALYSCRSRRRIAPWAISAGARRGGRAGPRRCKQHHTIPSNRSTAEPAGGIRSGAPRVFRVGVNAP